MERRQLEERFRYHEPRAIDIERALLIEERASDLAASINRFLPEGNEKTCALNRLEEVIFWSRSGLMKS